MPYGRFDIDVNAALSPKKVRPKVRPCHVDDETVIRMVSKGLGITMMTSNRINYYWIFLKFLSDIYANINMTSFYFKIN